MPRPYRPETLDYIYLRHKRRMTTPRIEKMVEEVARVCDEVEFLHGVPVKLPSQTKALLRGKVRKALTKAHQAGIDDAVEVINNTKTREMSVGENRSKYLAFNRGENHMKVKLLTKLQDNK